MLSGQNGQCPFFVLPTSLDGSHSLVAPLFLNYNVALVLYFQAASLKLCLTEVTLFTLKVESCAAIRALVCYCTSDIKQHSPSALLYCALNMTSIILPVSSFDLSIVVIKSFLCLSAFILHKMEIG